MNECDIVLATRTENSYLSANVKCSFYYIDIMMTAYLTIFRRFPTTFRRFPKILQNLSEGRTNVAKHFPEISEDF